MKDLLAISGFNPQQSLWLVAGFLFFLTSLAFHFKGKRRIALLLLTLGGTALFVFAALADPFLNLWDERFHALVAKNGMEHPFTPMLYPDLPITEYNPLIWSHAHVWLHKQPLFTWQIALSFKLFGVSEFTLRLPSIIMATLLIPIVYRMGRLLIDERLGYYAAMSATFSWFLLELVSGHGEVDHNNVCFVFYVTASVWAWMEYVRSGRRFGWATFAALLSGGAVLTKWLTGLLVYFVWGVWLLAEHRFRMREWKVWQPVAALAITIAVALPWQVYAARNFPDVWAFEQSNNSLHFTTSVEDHSGSVFYYLKSIPYLYIGDRNCTGSTEEALQLDPRRLLRLCLLLGGMGMLLWRMRKNSHRITLAATVLFVYLFFSMAATKMAPYPFIVCAAWFMGLGMLLWEAENLLSRLIPKRWIATTVLAPVAALFALYQFNFALFRDMHSEPFNYYRIPMMHNKEVFVRLKTQLPEKSVVFNVRGDQVGDAESCTTVEAMFYTGALCYAFVPTEEQMERLLAEGYHLAVFTHYDVPDYMRNRTDIQMVEESLLGDF